MKENLENQLESNKNLLAQQQLLREKYDEVGKVKVFELFRN